MYKEKKTKGGGEIYKLPNSNWAAVCNDQKWKGGTMVSPPLKGVLNYVHVHLY